MMASRIAQAGYAVVDLGEEVRIPVAQGAEVGGRVADEGGVAAGGRAVPAFPLGHGSQGPDRALAAFGALLHLGCEPGKELPEFEIDGFALSLDSGRLRYQCGDAIGHIHRRHLYKYKERRDPPQGRVPLRDRNRRNRLI